MRRDLHKSLLQLLLSLLFDFATTIRLFGSFHDDPFLSAWKSRYSANGAAIKEFPTLSSLLV
ncbi:hypothetical protein M5K25_012726 [Dendrobium thyrsiflorum]|uniref:Secreted protein n=1 Tax=Dendrobium thyrsiflorum TaxID=117978 RepID=A0ABD0UYP7_DENTH